jgi:hypothetical protein
VGHEKGIFFRIFLVILDKITKFGGEEKKSTKRERKSLKIFRHIFTWTIKSEGMAFFTYQIFTFWACSTNLSPFNAKSPLGFWHMTTTHQKKFEQKKTHTHTHWLAVWQISLTKEKKNKKMKFEKTKPLAGSVTNFATKENQKSKRKRKKETGLHYNKFRYQRKPKKKKGIPKKNHSDLQCNKFGYQRKPKKRKTAVVYHFRNRYVISAIGNAEP